MKKRNTTLALLMASAMTLPAGLAAAQDDADKPEIYRLMPDTALSGLVDPYMPDRTDIEKAWPKEPADPNDIKVGWTEITMGNPFFVELIKGAERAAADTNLSLDVQVADGDLQRQCAHIDTFITPNPYENGFGAGEYIAQDAGTDPIVGALIIGVVGNSTSESRLNGMVSGIVWQRVQDLGLDMTREDAMLRGYELFQQAKQSGTFNDEELGFQVVTMAEGNWTEEGGLAAAEDILTAHGSRLTHIIADNDWMGIGSLRALRNTGTEGVKVATSADGARLALEEIKKGNLLVTGTFSGEQMGVSTVAFLDQIFNEGLEAQNLPLGSYFPAYAITPENVDDFIDPNPENQFYKYEVSPVLNIEEIRAQAAAE